MTALRSTRLPYARATQIAARVGQVVAVFFAIVVLFGNLMLVFVAMFVFFAGRAEAEMVKRGEAKTCIRLGDVIQRPFRRLYVDSCIADVARQMLFASRRDFPVLQGRHQVGFVTAGGILSAMANGYGNRRVADVMRRPPQTTSL